MTSNHPLVRRADAFAVAAHADQRRKYTNEPYIVHPRAVMRLVQTVRKHTPEMLAAALLHDVLEDTEATHQQLYSEFGPEVAFLVYELTDRFTTQRLPHLNRASRKEAEAFRLAQTGPAVQTIKVADLIDNTKSIVVHDPKFARVYLREKHFLLSKLTLADEDLMKVALSSLGDE